MNEELSNLIWEASLSGLYEHNDMIQIIRLYWINRAHAGFINNENCHLFSHYRNNFGTDAEMLIEQAKHF